MSAPSSPSIKHKVIAGAAWMLAIKWISRLLGLVSTMVLARLLTPVDFGIVAIAMGLIGIMDAFFDFGFDLALIKNKNATREDYDLVWSLRLVNMITFGLLVAFLSPLVAQYSDSQEVILVCQVLGLSIALRGLGNVGTIDFQKELDFSKLFKFSLYPRILSVSTTVILAVVFRSYWAIIFGTLTNTLYTIGFSYVMSPFRPRLRFKGSEKVWSFSKWVLLTNLTRQFFNAADKFLLSGLVGKAPLGFYTMAGNLASIVTIELLAPVGSALMPGFAKLQGEQERIKSAFLQSLTVIVALSIPAATGVWLIAPELVSVLLGSQWGSSVDFVSRFGFFFMFFSLSETLSNFMAMVGLINRSSLVSMIRTIVFLATFYFAFKFQGLNGVILLKTVLGAIECILLFELSRRFVRLPGLTLPKILWRPLVSAASMVFVLSLLPHWADSSPFFILVIKAFTGAVTYASVSLLLWLIARRPDGIESLAIDIVLSKFSARLSTH